jgi:hypothetical protein
MATAKKALKYKTAAELKLDLEKAKQKVLLIEQLAYAGEIDELIKKMNIASSFNVIKANVKGATELAILAAIGKAVGIKRLLLSQAPAPTRAPADPNKPKKTTAAKKTTRKAKTTTATA